MTPFSRHFSEGSRSGLAVLEALYDLEQPLERWLRGFIRAAGPALDCGLGVGFLLYDVSGETLRVRAKDGYNLLAGPGTPADPHEDPATSRGLVRVFRREQCSTLDEHIPDTQRRELFRQRWARTGLSDHLLINGTDCSGFGFAILAASSQKIRLSSAERNAFSKLAAHLSAAYRLHRRLECSPLVVAAGEAILDTKGKMLHAAPEAKENETRRRLGAAVEQRESARRATPWPPLIMGRWSLIDRYERDGRRYVVACENRPELGGPVALSKRERDVLSRAVAGCSNKGIAYELGVAHSTVRVLLARAAAKFGARTRDELIARARGSMAF